MLRRSSPSLALALCIIALAGCDSDGADVGGEQDVASEPGAQRDGGTRLPRDAGEGQPARDVGVDSLRADADAAVATNHVDPAGDEERYSSGEGGNRTETDGSPDVSFVPEASADPEGGERPTIDATGPATDPDPFTPEPPDPDLVDIPKGDAGAAATAGEPIVVGGGGGGSISGSVMAYSPDVLHVSNVQGIVVIACHISPPYQACDASKSVAVRLTFGSLRGSYRLDGLLDDTYILLAYKDQNGDGARGPGDWSSTFSMDGRTTTLLTPPVENANLLMVPIEFDKTTLPPPQLDTIAGTWGSQMGDFASAIMHLYLDGTYDYTQSISNLNPNCSLAGDAFYTGTFSLQGTRLRFMPTSPEGGAIGGTCGVGAIGARRSEYFAELWGDEIGRVALYLRASTGPHVLEDVYLLK